MKTFKKQCQIKIQQNHRVWGNFSLQNCVLGSPRQVPKPFSAVIKRLKASPGSLCASCVALPGTTCEPLAPSRCCLGDSKSYLGSSMTKHVVLRGFGPPNFIQNQGFVYHVFNGVGNIVVPSFEHTQQASRGSYGFVGVHKAS